MKRLTAVFFSAILACAASSVAAQETVKRVALVIGNGEYENLPRLANPGNDARDLTTELTFLGFEVITLIDAAKDEIEESIFDFSRRLSGGNGVGLFYYAGHGVQSRGVNYLLPADIEIDSEAQLRIRAIDASLIYDYMADAGNSLNIIVLDACRDNPFSAGTFRSATRGLARVEELPKGSIIVYATQPGNVAEDGDGKNGTFTRALLDHIGTPNLDVKQVFDRVGAAVATATNDRQRPWINHDFYGNFSFAKATPGDVPGENSTAANDSATSTNAAEALEHRTGELFIVTTPPGAVIQIDGEDRGESPLLVDKLTLGTDLQITAITGNMRADEIIRLSDTFTQLVLELEIETGRLIILSNESEVNVYMHGGDMVGRDMGALGTGLFEEIPAGEYTVTLKGAGLVGEGRVSIAANATTQLRIEVEGVGSLDYVIPAGAEASVFLDGSVYTTLSAGTVILDDFPVGTYRVVAQGEGFLSEEDSITIRKGQRTEYRPMQWGKISLASEPSGAFVFLNDRNRGTTPLALSYIDPKTHRLRIEKLGYETVEFDLLVSGGKLSERTIELVAHVYRVGDAGPAGGTIFYDKGDYTDGWRFLEAAPGDVLVDDVSWGNNLARRIETLAEIGAGKSNTQTISGAHGSQVNAADLCKNFTFGGYNDWFLPSKDELNLLFQLKDSIGSFINDHYWSSTTAGTRGSLVWLQNFDTGYIYSEIRRTKARVRAIRAF